MYAKIKLLIALTSYFSEIILYEKNLNKLNK